jgi:L-ascorbate metabolism protein UlaG (beta-lactamase superfamily)
MIIKKLSWAGIQIKAAENSILIDPLGIVPPDRETPFEAKLGEPHETIFPLSNLARPDAILITHTHPDHFDIEGIKQGFGEDTALFLPSESVGFARKKGFTNVTGVRPGEEFLVKDLSIKVIPAVDGFGSPQVSWGVCDGNSSIIHAGDTLWHGLWWQIERKYGPFDLACLPVNGAILNVPGLKVQSDIKACMDPEEAASAAKIVGASKFLPIHYGTFHNPTHYMETDLVLHRLKAAAVKNEIEVCLLQPGEELDLNKMIVHVPES